MGITDRDGLARLFNEQRFRVGAEIGVSSGVNAERLCRTISSLTLYCIDPWRKYKGNRRSPSDQKHEQHLTEAKIRLANFNVVFLRMTSMEALKYVKDNELDFVFIDGNHSYKYVLDDITEWSKKVRPLGIIALHDYYQFKGAGVVEAVTDYIKGKPIKLELTTKHKPPRDSRCAWWYKPLLKT